MRRSGLQFIGDLKLLVSVYLECLEFAQKSRCNDDDPDCRGYSGVVPLFGDSHGVFGWRCFINQWGSAKSNNLNSINVVFNL